VAGSCEHHNRTSCPITGEEHHVKATVGPSTTPLHEVVTKTGLK
jgi:hypothetical protein